MQAAGGEQGEEAKKMLEDQDKLVEEIFSHEDKDKDGVISHEEFSGPKHDELWVDRNETSSTTTIFVTKWRIWAMIVLVGWNGARG